MSSFRFLHAADIHLDSPLHGLARYEGLPLDEVRGATRAAFARLVQFAIESEVAFLVIAGDLFDGDWKDMGTGLHFNGVISSLGRAGIPTFVSLGNHDAQSVVRRALPAADKVHVLSSRAPETVRIPDLGVAIHGWSFGQNHVTEDVTPRYPAPERGMFNIGVLHTSLGGHPGHASYAPCALSSLVSKEYQYWALGHVHDFGVLNEHPFVVYSGNLQGRNVRETGPKGAVLVEVRDGVVESVSHVPLDVVRWHRLDMDCTGLQEEADFHSRLKALVQEVCAGTAVGLPAVVRITLTGVTDLSDRFADGGAALRDEVRALASQVSADVWVEKLTVRTRALDLPGETSRDEMNLGAMLARALEDTELAEALKMDFRQFVSALRPPGDGADEGLLGSARADRWDEVAATAAAGLRARLTGAA